ncbi:hypothetical protein HK102_000165 [Quaeritorhiza haematococci]|nr:hypothetical protein HK102_000165 [Quaeritorhiza haematococci]
MTPILNYKFDEPDERDLVFKSTPPTSLPRKVDLRFVMPKVFDQGSLGSCTANVASTCLAYMFKKEGQGRGSGTVDVPSRLWIYWYTRVMVARGDPSEDSGASMRDTWKSIIRHQVCPETVWGYDIRRFAEKPDTQAHQTLCRIQSLRYEKVPQDLNSLKSCLAQGFPVSLGIRVYQSFMDNGVTGRIPTPDPNQEIPLGGHAIVLVGLAQDLWTVKITF